MMFKKSFFVAIALLFALASVGSAIAQTGEKPSASKTAGRDEGFDPVQFIKRFQIGMSYTEAQAALPKDFEQDILSYITTDEVFLLSVDIPGRAGWSASFKFDTLDTPMRRPERLIEMSCSAAFSGRGESFDSFVQKVTAAFGEPISVEHTEDKFKHAGWRVAGGSVLMLEYSVESSGSSAISVEFIIKKKLRRDAAGFKAVA